jgi:hypothetical protein
VRVPLLIRRRTHTVSPAGTIVIGSIFVLIVA